MSPSNPNSSPLRIHVAVLECDTLMPRARATYGGYTGLYENLLRKGLKNLKGEELNGDRAEVRGVGVVGGGVGAGSREREVDLKLSRYDVVEGKLPTEEELEGLDTVLVSGASE